MGIADWMFLSPQNPYVEALTLSITVCRDGTCRVVIKFKWGHENKALE